MVTNAISRLDVSSMGFGHILRLHQTSTALIFQKPLTVYLILRKLNYEKCKNYFSWEQRSVFFMIFSGFNLYCWKGIHFSQNNFLIFLLLFQGLIFSFHFWFRDLLRELDKKYEVLLIIFFLVFLLFLVSEGLLFVSFFWTSFHSLSSPTLGTWPGEGFYLPDPCELTFAFLLICFSFSLSKVHNLLSFLW